jgi:hypothetical protein
MAGFGIPVIAFVGGALFVAYIKMKPYIDWAVCKFRR